MSDNSAFSLNAHEVHIWYSSLAISVEQEQGLSIMLSPDEAQRAERFRFPIHRKHFIAARGFLRCLLSAYLKVKPENLIFAYTPKGKPYLSQLDLSFNVSHSDDHAVYAFTLKHDIGIDIEKIEVTYDDAVASRFYSAEEYEQLQALPLTERAAGFYRIWSRKEALVKAIGEGLGFSLASFTVPITNPLQAQEMRFGGSNNWHLQSFEVSERFAAAVATRQKVGKLIQRQWEYNRGLLPS